MGKLGKPQRSKKHKKIKAVDPFYEGDRKNRREKLSNLAPKNEDEQAIPRKVQFFIDLKGDEKNFVKKKKRKKNRNQQHNAEPLRVERGMSRPLKPVPKFVQGKRETDKSFMNRVELETQRVLLKSKLTDKYKVDFDDLEQGNVVKKKKSMSQQKKERLKEKKKKNVLKKVEKKRDKEGDFSDLRDNVKFGEVAMEPPAITAKPRKAETDDGVPRPGKKSLLLKEIITDNAITNSGHSTANKTRELGQTKKRKHLSMAQQQIMDKEREKAIDLYRQLKAKKMKTS